MRRAVAPQRRQVREDVFGIRERGLDVECVREVTNPGLDI